MCGVKGRRFIILFNKIQSVGLFLKICTITSLPAEHISAISQWQIFFKRFTHRMVAKSNWRQNYVTVTACVAYSLCACVLVDVITLWLCVVCASSSAIDQSGGMASSRRRAADSEDDEDEDHEALDDSDAVSDDSDPELASPRVIRQTNLGVEFSSFATNLTCSAPQLSCLSHCNYNHVVDTCPLKKFVRGLNLLHDADEYGCNLQRLQHMRNDNNYNANFVKCIPLNLVAVIRFCCFFMKYHNKFFRFVWMQT